MSKDTINVEKSPIERGAKIATEVAKKTERFASPVWELSYKLGENVEKAVTALPKPIKVAGLLTSGAPIIIAAEARKHLREKGQLETVQEGTSEFLTKIGPVVAKVKPELAAVIGALVVVGTMEQRAGKRVREKEMAKQAENTNS